MNMAGSSALGGCSQRHFKIGDSSGIRDNSPISGVWSVAWPVNNDGWIAGSEFFTNLANGYPTVRAGGPPVLITNTPFGPPHNYINLESVVPGAVAINDSGQVLLHVRYNYRATSSDPELSDFAIFIWQDGINQTVPGIGGPPAMNGGSQTFASDLNNRGEAVGRDASGVWSYLPQAAYGLSSGLHILDPEFSAGQKINDLGARSARQQQQFVLADRAGA